MKLDTENIKMSSKRALTVLGRLPLLFVIDSICKGTFLIFTSDFFGIGENPVLSANESFRSTSPLQSFLHSFVTGTWLLFVTVTALVLVCSPISTVLESYGCVVGAMLTWLSYNCNRGYVSWQSPAEVESVYENSTIAGDFPNQSVPVTFIRATVSLITQLFIMLGFEQICVAGILNKKKMWTVNMRYPVDVMLFVSFSLPIFLSSVLTGKSAVYNMSPVLAAALPSMILLKYSVDVFSTVFFEILLPGIRYMKDGVRELGLDGLIMQVMEHANAAWLLRSFFVTQLLCQVMNSKTLQDSDHWMSYETLKLFILEILYEMCSSIISIMSLASVISIISGLCLSCVYKVIEGNEEEEGLQPVISGFLFVLLAMQTGITSISGEARLQLLFQNSILLVVANQHFVHSVAADLLLKASMDDSAVSKHVRPLLPFCFFFTFPYFVVLPLWDYSFRLSWLLAITAFSIELIIKSLTTLLMYAVNMCHAYSNLLGDSTDVILFYIQAVCGCLEFICAIFLFVNGAYIFFFESGGRIRLFMMTVHFYCNIYQRAIKGWASYKLRISSWEKVNRLRAAKQEELDDKEICSICYQEMSEAVVLDCNHVFHKNCLQKWLSIQDTCPLCHEKLKDEAAKQQRRAGYV